LSAGADIRERTGRCLCGAVRVRISGARTDFGICHCKMCQRWTGAMFAGLTVRPEEIAIEGLEQVREYRSSEHATRSFCATCGSALWFSDWRDGTRRNYEIPVGLLDDAAGLRLQVEIWTDMKPAAWSLAGDHDRITGAEVPGYTEARRRRNKR
jgi:hypothetical protein